MKSRDFWTHVKMNEILLRKTARERKVSREIRIQNFLAQKKHLNYLYGLENNLVILGHTLRDKTLYRLFKMILKEAYDCEFQNSSSVEDNFHTILPYVPKNIELSKQINLFEHTLGVLNTTIDIVPESYLNFIDYLMLTSLLHDYGKSPRLKEKFGLSKIGNEEGHHKASAEYFRKILLLHKGSLSELHTPVPFGHPADFLSDTQPESIRTASRF